MYQGSPAGPAGHGGMGGKAEFQILLWGKAGVMEAQNFTVTRAPLSPEPRPGDLSRVVLSCLTPIQTQVMAHPCRPSLPSLPAVCPARDSVVQPHPRASSSHFVLARALFRVNKPWRFGPRLEPRGVSAPMLACVSLHVAPTQVNVSHPAADPETRVCRGGAPPTPTLRPVLKMFLQ